MIYINGRIYEQLLTGVQRVGVEMIRTIDKYVKENSMVLIVSENCPALPKLQNIEIKKVGKKGNTFWCQITLPLYVKKRGGELLTFGGLPPLMKPDYCYIHDITYWRIKGSFSWKIKWSYYLGYKIACRKAKKILTVSDFSKKELIELYGVDSKKINVIYNAPARIMVESNNDLDRFSIPTEDFYLCVGSRNKHKNQEFIIELARIHKDKFFVIVGAKHMFSFNDISFKEKLGNNVILTDYICDNDLIELYRKCKGFIFPSLYEGFGMPPLEAITYGAVRIAVSDIPAHREIYSDSVYFFNPKDPLSFDFDMFLQTKIDVNSRSRYKIKYTWEKSARKLLDVLPLND